MANFTVATNLLGWILLEKGLFGWPDDSEGVKAHIASMQVGDLIIPKFSQNATYVGAKGHEPYQEATAKAFGVDYNAALASYAKRIAGGAGAVHVVLRVASPRFERAGEDVPVPTVPWSCVSVDPIELPYPISTNEYLRLRAIPVAVGIQFKATVAPGRHVQPLSADAGEQIIAAGQVPHRGPELLRTESLVKAESVEDAVAALATAGHPPLKLDRAFVVAADRMIGLCECQSDGQLIEIGTAIERPPLGLTELFAAAKAAQPSFRASRPLQAAGQLGELLTGPSSVVTVPELGHFHDRFVLLPQRINTALDLVAAAAAGDTNPSGATDGGKDDGTTGGGDDDEATAGELLIEQVEGLDIAALEKALPKGVVIDPAVLAETATALRAGKHLILSGPPGTGKSTLAAAICDAVGASFRTATATADWSTVDTIGAYLPDGGGGLAFEEGVVLGALDSEEWLVIDELNRADIDKAFGPLFTVLAGAGGSGSQTVTLPYRGKDGKRIQLGWANTAAESKTTYAVTRAWRLIGTLNDSDKSSLYSLSFAFLRRFAVIDVGLPPTDTYRALVKARLPSAAEHEPALLLEAAMRVAHGPVPLGPAILLDIAEFTRRGVTGTASGGTPFATALDALLTAVRLYAVPQYEGAEDDAIAKLKLALTQVIAVPPEQPWQRLVAALDRAGINAL